MAHLLMSRALIVLRTPHDREKAAHWCRQAPYGCRVEFKAVKRSLPQNSMMWALLTDLSCQLKWHGAKLSPEDWKIVMLDGLRRELRLVPNIDGDGFVQLGRSSSDLSKTEMADLLELILAFGAKHGVTFGQNDVASAK